LDNTLEITVPEILSEIPPKLIPLITKINDFRYFLIEGGRGGGKSHTVARLLLYCAEKLKLRIVCGREIQNTIQESVYTLISELIFQYRLYFEVGANKITHRGNETTFNFRGFREQGAINIQGMEGVDVVWIDEAQGITKKTLDALIPTIRKEKAKIFFTMNRFVRNDPVYQFCQGRADCLHIKINYTDNPKCPEALKHEAAECQAKSPEDYEHIWLGEPLPKEDDALLTEELVYTAPKLEFYKGSGGLVRRILGVDVARFGEDETVFSIIETKGVTFWEHIYQDTKRNKDTMWTTGQICDLQRRFNVDLTVVDEGGIGGGVIDRLTELTHPVIAFDGSVKAKFERYSNARSQGYFDLKELLERGHLKLLNDPALLEQLLNIRFKYKSSGQRAIISKDEMRKEGVKSPDRADALMMAVSQIDDCLSHKHDKENINPQYGITEDEALLGQGQVNTPLPAFGLS